MLKKSEKIIFKTCFFLVFLAVVYLYLVFTNNHFISKWRTIYIETAMTTNSHQWLATCFLPRSVIENAMADRKRQELEQQKLASTWASSESDFDPVQAGDSEELSVEPLEADVVASDTPADLVPLYGSEGWFYDKYWELCSDSFKNYLAANPDLLNNSYSSILIDNLNGKADIRTTEGDLVVALDAVNNTLILKVDEKNYEGKLAIIKNPSQVGMVSSRNYGIQGEQAGSYSERTDAEVVVNASGFRDINWKGNGARAKGSYVLDGEEYGAAVNDYWKFAGMKQDGRFYISTRGNTDIQDYRWGLEFYPALIVDGVNAVDGTYCMGLQPRTAIGQADNGDFLLLVVDGRQAHSIGCTVADCRDVLLRYHAYQGMNVDGGSSSVMYYKGKLISKPSSAGGVGRHMPNAIVVNKYTVSEVTPIKPSKMSEKY